MSMKDVIRRANQNSDQKTELDSILAKSRKRNGQESDQRTHV